ELSRGALVFAFLIAIGFAIAVFKVGPALITDQLPIRTGEYFVVVEGLIRVSMFVGYLALISLLPDLRRVFQYHAAEHKAINAYEAGEPLEPEVVQRYSLIHPRCGTAFLLWVMVIAVFVFAFFGRPVWYWLVATPTGASGAQPVSWAARSTDETSGVTSPEELIAAAHAACFSMALSNGLSKDGHPPDELRTSATVTFQPGEGITRIALTVDGRV